MLNQTVSVADPVASRTIGVPPMPELWAVVAHWSAPGQCHGWTDIEVYTTERRAIERGDRSIESGLASAYRVFRLPGDGAARRPRLGDGFTLDDIENMRKGFHATYNGGHHDEIPREAFHHGMDTVFNSIAGGIKARTPIAEAAADRIDAGGMNAPLVKLGQGDYETRIMPTPTGANQ
jgi:hypothetical protein